MKTLLTPYEAMERGLMPKQVRSSDCDYRTYAMVAGSLQILGLRDYIEIEMDGGEMVIRACVAEDNYTAEKHKELLDAKKEAAL